METQGQNTLRNVDASGTCFLRFLQSVVGVTYDHDYDGIYLIVFDAMTFVFG